MPPRRRAVGVKTPDSPEQQHLAAPHEGIPEDELSDDVNNVLDELGENVSAVVVYRMKENKPGEWDYVTRIPATEFTQEYLKEQYGGGDYKLHLIDKVQGAINPVLISIDRRFVGKLFAQQPAVPAASQDAFKDRLLEILLTKMLTQPAPVPVQQGMDAKTVLEIAALFKDSGNSGGGLEMVKTVMETATAMAGMMNPPEGFAGMAAQFLPVIERLVPPRTNAPRPLPPRNVPSVATPTLTVTQPNSNAPAGAPVTVVEQPPAHVAGTIFPKWLAPFRTLAPMLVRLADSDADPTLYADVALDRLQTDDAVFAAAVEAMNESRLLTDLYAVAPALQETETRKDFAAKLVARIEEGVREILSDDSEEKTNAQG